MLPAALPALRKGTRRPPKLNELSRIPRVAFGLCEHVLETEGEFLRLDDAKDLSIVTKGVISRAVGRSVFLDATGGAQKALCFRPTCSI